MKKNFIFIASVLLIFDAVLVSGCKKVEQTENVQNAAQIIGDIPTVQFFLEDKVDETDLNQIILAGINAQSGMNGQPWHFSIVKSKAIQNQVADEMRSFMPENLPESAKAKAGFNGAPVAIVVSGKENSDFDAALASQAIVAEAVVLGYGTKIIASPNIVFHGEKRAEYKSLLKIPDDMETIAVVLIGKPDNEKIDALSQATLRKSYDKVVSVIE